MILTRVKIKEVELYNILLGGTPLGMYQNLIKMYKEGNVSFKHVITFNMDEYVGMLILNLS